MMQDTPQLPRSSVLEPAVRMRSAGISAHAQRSQLVLATVGTLLPMEGIAC